VVVVNIMWERRKMHYIYICVQQWRVEMIWRRGSDHRTSLSLARSSNNEGNTYM
jgi:hypothetical protein